jgi:hypothetical protein
MDHGIFELKLTTLKNLKKKITTPCKHNNIKGKEKYKRIGGNLRASSFALLCFALG